MDQLPDQNFCHYGGASNTSAIFLAPPDELNGKINIVPEMMDVMHLAITDRRGEYCSGNIAMLKKVRDRLLVANPYWTSIDYDNIKFLPKATRRLLERCVLPRAVIITEIVNANSKEGYPIWLGNVAEHNGGKNVQNAKAFQSFVMDPKKCATDCFHCVRC